MSNVALAAVTWHAAGVSTIPIEPTGTKKPAFKWAKYQQELPTPEEVEQWFTGDYGLALIMGQVSGNLEMLELEGRACNEASLQAIREACEARGIGAKWARFLDEGYQEESPNGGLHFIYRVHGRDVPGNEKIARRPANAAELAENPKDKVKVLAETRGEGGYVIVAPTSGKCHPSGRPWTVIPGSEPGEVISLTWETRCLIHDAIREALDQPLESNLPVPASANPPGQMVGTGHLWDDWDRTAHFPSLLRERGWTSSRNEREWTRPGKDPRDGTSATLDHDGTNRLFVFSTASGLDTDRYFSPFEFVAYSDFGGDIKAALAELHIVSPKASIEDFTYVAEIVPEEAYYSFTDTGNAQRLAAADSVRGQFHYIHETKEFLHWTGTHWAIDHDGGLTREWQKIAERLSDDPDEATSKWGKQCLNVGRVKAALDLFRAIQGVTKSTANFNQNRQLLNVANGTLNLRTGELKPHDAGDRITRMFGASYDPAAKCPNWTAFVERVIPDAKMRAYVQRAVGYSLLGDGDQRSLFVLHGPSGTGKSTFLETLRQVFADYGTTAPAGAFKARRSDAAPTTDLHSLRGKRFVVTSETAERAEFDEELLKRLTGRDSIQSRELYQANQEWSPECVLWIATNHAPKFNSDDDAIWRRLKLIPFPQPITAVEEIADMARRVLVPEADGILNWLLAGLRAFLANGLDEPDEVIEAARGVRLAGDSVARFVEDSVAAGRLQLTVGEVTNNQTLLKVYQSWCRDVGERPLGSRRFQNRLSSLYPELTLSHDNLSWLGLALSARVGFAGTFFD